MFRLEESWGFYLLLLIPLVLLWTYWTNNKMKKSVKSFGDPMLFDRLLVNKAANKIGLISIIGTIFFMIFAMVNPQFGLKKEKVKVEKSDIVIALDISNSMNATDISPSRLEKAKRFISQLIHERKGDQIGLILFAGGAYLQMPLTSDYAAADLFTKSANTEMAGTQGTAIGEAIRLAMRSVKEDNQRALIILTDGEDHDDDAISVAGDATSRGWNIFTIAVGTEEGGFVPVLQQGREEFKIDENGNPVKTKVNYSLLQSLADKGNGLFYKLSDGESNIINDLNTQIERLQKRAIEVKSFTEYRSFYQYFLFLGIIFCLLGFFYSPIKKDIL